MIKIGDKVRCVKDVMLEREGAIGIVREEIIRDRLFGIEWVSGEYKFDVTGVAKWCVELEEIELIEDFEDKSIQVDDDGVLFWNDGNGDEIIGNVKYLDRDVLIDVFNTLVDERDDYKVENYMLKDDIDILKEQIELMRGED